MLQALYPIMYTCKSWIAVSSLPVNHWNRVSNFDCSFLFKPIELLPSLLEIRLAVPRISLEERCFVRQSMWSLIHPAKHYCYRNFYLWRQALQLNFISVYPALQRTKLFIDSYFTLLLIIVVKTETDIHRIYWY